jgi:hypothetical protein
MEEKTRGDNTMRQRAKVPKDVRWGNYDPDEWVGRVTVMAHPAYGELFFPTEDVESRTKRGWVVVEYVDPTSPVSITAQEPGGLIGSRPAKDRDEVAEAKPKPAPKSRRPSRARK